jgi:hypothetical protein
MVKSPGTDGLRAFLLSGPRMSEQSSDSRVEQPLIRD